MEILVTNFAKGLKDVPFNEVYPDRKIEVSKFVNSANEFTINGCLSVHVFDKLPYMRNMPGNESWFNSDLFHFA